MLRGLFFLALLPAALVAQAGNTGMSFLGNGVGARNIAMGESGVAAAHAGTALYFNPSIIAAERRPSIVIAHTQSIEDINAQFLGVVLPSAGWSFGMQFGIQSVPGIPIRDVPGPALGDFTSRDIVFGLSAATQLGSAIDVGATAKLLYEKIYVDDATGYAVDLGVRVRPIDAGAFKDLSLGASLSNLGSMSDMRTEATTLPKLLRFGAAWGQSFGVAGSAITVAADGVKVLDGDVLHLQAGVEVCYEEMAFLRAGYQSNYDTKGFTAGLGVAYSVLRFDYALTPGLQSFGSTHAFSVSILF